jgi:hypothetical protein
MNGILTIVMRLTALIALLAIGSIVAHLQAAVLMGRTPDVSPVPELACGSVFS